MAPGMRASRKSRPSETLPQSLALDEEEVEEKMTPLPPPPPPPPTPKKRRPSAPPPPPPRPLFDLPLLLVFVAGVVAGAAAVLYLQGGCSVQNAHLDADGVANHFPLWTEPHSVVSIPADLDNWEDRRTLSEVGAALESHAADHTCVCMHHLEASSEVTARNVCAVSLGPSYTVLMINPVIRGASKDEHMYRQWSVACPRVMERARPQSLHVEWTDWKTHSLHGTRVDGLAAACLELAVEEMQGRVECNDTFNSSS